MKKLYPYPPIHIGIIAVSFTIFIASCSSPKNAVYFQSIQRDTTLHGWVNDNMELRIRKNDLLGINIISPDPITTPLFNGAQLSPAGSTTTPGSGGGNTNGYIVDNKGNIEIYKIGIIHVEGMTRSELKQKLEKEISPYLRDAVINIRFLNNRVTILGEISTPQVITMPSEKMTILEAIGQSGDIPITGRKDYVLLIRDSPAGKQFKRLDLTDHSIFNSPFYYLKPDDVIYIEPTEYKIKNAGNTPQLIGYVLSGVSILITLLAYLVR